jgi:hypothetical protein
VESVFEIIAEPNRRAILSLLVSSQQSVGEIERQLRMTQPTVSKHLRVLREGWFRGIHGGCTAPSLPVEIARHFLLEFRHSTCRDSTMVCCSVVLLGGLRTH